MKIAICDDEKEICCRLKKLVYRQRPDCEVFLFESGRQMLQSRRLSIIDAIGILVRFGESIKKWLEIKGF